MIDTRASSGTGGAERVQAAEASISRFCADLVDTGAVGVLAHPVRAVRVWAAAGRLPVLRYEDLEGTEGRLLHHVLDRSGIPPLRRLLQLRSVLVLPDPVGDLRAGWGGRTLWKKVRGAARRGIHVEPVDEAPLRTELMAAMVAREQTHPNAAYRVADPDLAHLLPVRTWLAARDSGGETIAIAVAAHSAEWGMLCYMRSLVDSDDASLARYLLTERTVAAMQSADVRYIVDTASPFRLPNGLRHFQRMLGWRIHRVRRGA